MDLGNIFKKKKSKKKKTAKTAKKTTKKKTQGSQKKETGMQESELEIDRDEWPIKATAIVEILGSPKDHVIKTMDSYIEKMKKEKNIKILEAKKSKVEQKEKLFSIFADIEMLAKTPSNIVDYCFDYMPSSIELIEPENVKFNSHEFSNFFNDLQARLHQLDMIVKKLRAENKVLNQNAHFILRNNILLSLREKPKDLATISKNIGIPEDKTKVFLDSLVKQGFVNLEKDKYKLNSNKVSFSE